MGKKDREPAMAPPPPGKLNINTFPEDVRKNLFIFDTNHDGFVDAKELTEALSTHNAVRSNSSRIPFSAFPESLRAKLAVFDKDGDQTIEQSELAAAADMYSISKQKNTQLKKVIAGLGALLLVVLTAIFGLTFAVVELSKETSTRDDGIMTVKGQTGSVVKTGDILMEGALSSAMPDSFFEELKTFRVENDDSTISIQVNGFLRTGKKDSIERVMIFTPIGEIVLVGENMSFMDGVASHFRTAGFKTDGRRLLSLYKLVGLFNSIENYEGSLTVPDIAKPTFGDQFTAEYDIYYRCLSGNHQDSDERCNDYETVSDIDIYGSDDKYIHAVEGTLVFDNGRAFETRNLLHTGSDGYINAKYFIETAKESGSWIYKDRAGIDNGFNGEEATADDISNREEPDVAFCDKDTNSADVNLGEALAKFFTGLYAGSENVMMGVKSIGGESLNVWKLSGDRNVQYAEMTIYTNDEGEIRRIDNFVLGEHSVYVFKSFKNEGSVGGKSRLPAACSNNPIINMPGHIEKSTTENPLVAVGSHTRHRELRSLLQEKKEVLDERIAHQQNLAIASRSLLGQEGRDGRKLQGKAKDMFKAFKKFFTQDSPIEVVYSEAQMPTYCQPCVTCIFGASFGKFGLYIGWASLESSAPCSIAISAEVKLGVAAITGEVAVFFDADAGLFEINGCIGLAVFSVDVLQVCVFGGIANSAGHPCGQFGCNKDDSKTGGYVGGYAHANVVFIWADVWYTYYFPSELDSRGWHTLKWVISAGLNIGFLSFGGIIAGNAAAPLTWYEDENGNSIDAYKPYDPSEDKEDVGEVCGWNSDCATTQCCWCSRMDSWRCDTESDGWDYCEGSWANSRGGCH